MSDVHPKSGETPNARRATWARRALDTFTRETMGGRSVRKLLAESGVDGDAFDACGDLVCDLLHFMAGRKMDYVSSLRRALDHFTVERAQEGRKVAEELADILARNPMAQGAALSPGAAAEILATHNSASQVGAALGVAVGGIAALCSQIESAMNGDDYSPAQACVSVAGQGRALLNRLGRMVGPKPGDMIEGRDSLVHPHPSDDLRAVLEDARGKLGVVARFILDGEEKPGEEGEGEEPVTCEMSIDDAYDTAQLAVEAVRAVCADIDKALGGAPAPRALEDIAADNLRGRTPEALALLGDLLALGRERELAFKENDGPLLRLCIRAAAICGASGWFHAVAAAPAWDGVERRKGARRVQAWGESAGHRSGVDRRKGPANG